MNRRTFLGSSAAMALPLATDAIEIDPRPLFDLSPYLYMQFMEPLGATDSSVEAAWDHRTDVWREDVVETTADLAPTMMRWGGIYADYYKWREGVGPRDKRVPIRNLLWGGIESNQVGTAEFVEFSRRVGAEPLICVNFESDGRQRFVHRAGDAREAADWVAYCNRPDNRERIGHGAREPFNVPFWQLGNETSYDPNGFDLKTAVAKTVEFAKAMRAEDPSIKLIGWAGLSRGKDKEVNWAKGMMEGAGEHLKYLAFHHMYNPDDRGNPALEFGKFRDDPARAWDVLMNAWRAHEERIQTIRDNLGGEKFPLAMTECHYSIPGRARCEVLSTWAAGVSYARLLNVHERHGDLLKIATAADFCGNRWQVNAVMIPVPPFRGKAFLMPVAHVMRLYRRHSGEQALEVKKAPSDLDVTASRSGNKFVLHVVNTNRTRAVSATVPAAAGGTVYEIAANPEVEMRRNNPEVLRPRERVLPAGGKWSFPAASVSAVEFEGRT